MHLVDLAHLRPHDVERIWSLAELECPAIAGTVGWSFEGKGIRTRTTFLRAFRDIGLRDIELPGLLKSAERPYDVAGYLDAFYDLYVVRESNHARLAEFAAASRHPVINAMSSHGHPCEVLTDAWSVHRSVRPLAEARICLWGPTTNVFRSWHQLAQVLGLDLVHACEARFHETLPQVRFVDGVPDGVDVVVTDGWLVGYDNPAWSLNEDHLARMGTPRLLPTPPFTIGHELAIDPLAYPGFLGYQQKNGLLQMQKAIIRFLLGA
jgi:ornithine carbamoyltransferase